MQAKPAALGSEPRTQQAIVRGLGQDQESNTTQRSDPGEVHHELLQAALHGLGFPAALPLLKGRSGCLCYLRAPPGSPSPAGSHYHHRCIWLLGIIVEMVP